MNNYMKHVLSFFVASYSYCASDGAAKQRVTQTFKSWSRETDEDQTSWTVSVSQPHNALFNCDTSSDIIFFVAKYFLVWKSFGSLMETWITDGGQEQLPDTK